MIKSVLILNHGVIPPNLHYNQPNEYIDFKSHNLKVVSSETKIDNQIHIGISSFGFGGSNAHIILKGVDAGVRKAIEDIKIPFDRGRSALLKDYYQLNNIEFRAAVKESGSIPERQIDVAHVDAEVPTINGINNKLTREDVQRLVQELFFKVTNIETIDSDVELIEQGLDSLSVTEFISQLQSSLGIEIDPDLIFEHPLPDQLIDEIHALI